MNAGAVVCEVCGSTDDVARRWIPEHDERIGSTTWTDGLLCAGCSASQEQPPEIAGDPEAFEEPSHAAGPPLPEPAVQLGFKGLTLENWRQPDPDSAAWEGVSPLDGRLRNLTGEDWAYHILAVPLAAVVPVELRRLFEAARGTMLYGWFFYPAYTLASEQLLRVAAAAVARRCADLGAPRSRETFEQQLIWLGQQGRLSDVDLDDWTRVRKWRNLATHPEDQDVLYPGLVVTQVRLLAEAIGALFQQGD